jgi:anti-sigma regulatory factor (Ser/Thr protein kinase)
MMTQPGGVNDLLIPVQNQTDVAFARRIALRAAENAGHGEKTAGTVGIVVTEAATNLLKHAGSGEIVVKQAGSLVEIMALDRGPGMKNVEQCFEDGYSTAGSPGTGLGAIARLSQFHQIYSQKDRGTVLVARIGGRPNGNFESGSICVALPGEELCGDAWAMRSSTDSCRVVVADGLGHGLYASQASTAAVACLEESNSDNSVSLMHDIHARLRPTRGAAVAIAEIDAASEVVRFSGVGNVAGVIVSDAGTRQMVSMNGTVGAQFRRVQEFQYPLDKGSLVVLHSDGLSSNWSLDKYPQLSARHPSVVAGILFRDHRRSRDDATVVVIRLRESP